MSRNNVRKLREAQLMSKAELARKAGVSPLTIDRVESGKPCRMDTKRKIILGLGYKLRDRHKVFPDDEGGAESPRRARRKKTESAAAASDPAASSDKSGSVSNDAKSSAGRAEASDRPQSGNPPKTD